MLSISQVIAPKVMFFEPIDTPRALNTGTCIQQGDLFYSPGLHRNHVLAIANTGEIGRGFRKNAGEWTGRAEISKEEIHGSKRCMYGYILTYPKLYRENLQALNRWDFNFCVRTSPLRGGLCNRSKVCSAVASIFGWLCISGEMTTPRICSLHNFFLCWLRLPPVPV